MMWLMVCRWPQSQEGDWARPHLCKLARHGPWLVQKRFIRNHGWWGRSKSGYWIVKLVTIVWLTTEAYDQSSLHCVTASTDVMSDHIGCRDATRGGRCSNTSAYTGQFEWASNNMTMIWSLLPLTMYRRRCNIAEHWQPWELRGFAGSLKSGTLHYEAGTAESDVVKAFAKAVKAGNEARRNQGRGCHPEAEAR